MSLKHFFQEELKLYQILLNIRTKLARDIGTAPYAICGDQTLRHFAKIRPSTGARLANIDGVNQHFISRYSGTFVQSITQLSKELNLPLDDSSGVEEMLSVSKPVTNNNVPMKVGDAKFTSWELWQNQKYSFKKIAHFHRAVPIKEQTVVSYILDAARDGCEMNWNRFCEETGLTHEIASQIRLAIAKVGSREKMKPIKDEVPENVTYDMIKTFFTIDDLGVSEKRLVTFLTAGPEQSRQNPVPMTVKLSRTVIRETLSPWQVPAIQALRQQRDPRLTDLLRSR